MSHTDAQGQAGGTFPLGKVPSGIEGLDTILKGGFLQGGITIVQGKPGAGKTILGNQLCFNHIAAGGRALYVTLLAESHSRMLLHIGGLAFFRGAVIPDQLSYFSDWAVKAQGLKDELLFLVDEDTAAFQKVMEAFALPKDSTDEKAARSLAIQAANKYAAEIPLRVMETASQSYQVLAEMAEKGNPASLSDVGVGLLATHACIEGAAMNVRINLGTLKDEQTKKTLLTRMREIAAESDTRFKQINQLVDKKLT